MQSLSPSSQKILISLLEELNTKEQFITQDYYDSLVHLIQKEKIEMNEEEPEEENYLDKSGILIRLIHFKLLTEDMIKSLIEPEKFNLLVTETNEFIQTNHMQLNDPKLKNFFQEHVAFENEIAILSGISTLSHYASEDRTIKWFLLQHKLLTKDNVRRINENPIILNVLSNHKEPMDQAYLDLLIQLSQKLNFNDITDAEIEIWKIPYVLAQHHLLTKDLLLTFINEPETLKQFHSEVDNFLKKDKDMSYQSTELGTFMKTQLEEILQEGNRPNI